MITKKLEIEELKQYWKENAHLIDDGYFMEDIEFSEIIRLTDRDYYVNIIRLYGINNLLILLNFLEAHDQFETCAEIVSQIIIYNKTFGTEYITHL